tara:strand:- start:828 stop:1016 length:189 start_codon:yes stop_codon:yes gene_type:complete
MKIKIKDKNMALPNCWKSCGVDKDAWDELQDGKEVEVKQIAEAIEGLIETVVVKATTKKESK